MTTYITQVKSFDFDNDLNVSQAFIASNHFYFLIIGNTIVLKLKV